MPTPERPVLPDHPTKHQLDELDALMERMLALPVNQPEDLVSMPRLPARPVKTVSLPMVQPTFAVSETLEPKQVSKATPAPVLASAIKPVRSQLQERAFAPRAVSFWLQPAVWCNRVYDAGTAMLGPPGRWLRGRKGRTMLGLTGLALITAALAWAAVDTWGWTW